MCLFIGQYLTSSTSSDQSGLFTAGIACLIISLLSIIFVVSFVFYWRKFKHEDAKNNADITKTIQIKSCQFGKK